MVETYKAYEKRRETGAERPMLQENLKDSIITTNKRQSQRGVLALANTAADFSALLLTQQISAEPK